MIIEKATARDLPMLYRMQKVGLSAIKYSTEKGDLDKAEDLQAALLPVQLRIEELEAQLKAKE